MPASTGASPLSGDTRASQAIPLIGAVERLYLDATFDPATHGPLLDTWAFTAVWMCVDEQATAAELVELSYSTQFTQPSLRRTSVWGERRGTELRVARVEEPGAFEVVVWDTSTESIVEFCADRGVWGVVSDARHEAGEDRLIIMEFDPDELDVSALPDITAYCEAGRAVADPVGVASQSARDGCVGFEVDGEAARISRELCSRTDPVAGESEVTVRSGDVVRQLRFDDRSVLATKTTDDGHWARIVAPVGPNLLLFTEIRWDAAPQLGAPAVIERMIDVPDETLTVSEIVERLDRTRAESRRGVVEIRSDCSDAANAVAEQLVVEYDAR